MDIMGQSACLVVNPIMVYSYGFLFNYTTDVGCGLRLKNGPDVKILSAGRRLVLVFGLAHRSST